MEEEEEENGEKDDKNEELESCDGISLSKRWIISYFLFIRVQILKIIQIINCSVCLLLTREL